MKRNILACLALLIFLLSCGTYSYFYVHERNINESFLKDVVHTLIQLRSSMKMNIERNDTGLYSFGYSLKECATENIKELKKWNSDRNNTRKNVSNEMLEGYSDILAASDAMIGTIKGKTANDVNENLAIFKVKLEKGRDKILESIIPLAVPNKLKLFKHQKIEILSYIDSNFSDELLRHYHAKANNKIFKKFTQAAEVWAIVLLRNGLAGDDPKLAFDKINILKE